MVHFVNAQQATIYHVVADGETLSKIAQKYKITPYDIIKLNPKAVNGVHEKEVLIIPKSVPVIGVSSVVEEAANDDKSNRKQSQFNTQVHVVQSKETKFGISKLYGISISQLEAQNPHIIAGLQVGHKLRIKEPNTTFQQNLKTLNTTIFDSEFNYVVLAGETLYGISKRNSITVDELIKVNASVLNGVLKKGQKLTIPVKKAVINTNSVQLISSEKYHVVEPKETKFGLSKQFGITIDQLENLNPQIVKGLQIGQKINFPSGYVEKQVVSKKDILTEIKKEITVNENSENHAKIKESILNSNQEYFEYEIQPKETLFGLSKKAGMTVSDFTTLNPKVATGVQIGMKIKMPKINNNNPLELKFKSDKIIDSTLSVTSNRYKNLVATIDKSSKKQITIGMPFDESKYNEYLKTSNNFIAVEDNFIKNNLEFYSGAKAAIDSLKVIGLNFDVKVIELQSNTDNAVLDTFVKNEEVNKSNIIILPFYEKAVSQVASDFNKQNLPVITNQLSDNDDVGFSNLYIAVPSDKVIRNSMLDYLKSKNASVIVVSSTNRIDSKKDILEKFSDAKFVKVSDKNVVDTEDLKRLLNKNELNYVILDTDKNSMIISATNILLNQFSDFQIQIAVLEPSLLSHFENISSIRINILKMIYPSFNSVQKSKELVDYVEKNNSKNSILLSQNYFIGFDITFDTLMRLVQNKGFEKSVKEDVTEYLKLKFEYNSTVGNKNNKGFYILQHDTDNKIKELN